MANGTGVTTPQNDFVGIAPAAGPMGGAVIVGGNTGATGPRAGWFVAGSGNMSEAARQAAAQFPVQCNGVVDPSGNMPASRAGAEARVAFTTPPAQTVGDRAQQVGAATGVRVDPNSCTTTTGGVRKSVNPRKTGNGMYGSMD